MTITHIGSVAGDTGNASSDSDLVLTIPGTYAADDIAIACVGIFGPVAKNLMGINAEYTLLVNLSTEDGNDRNCSIFYRKLTSGSDTALTISKSGLIENGDDEGDYDNAPSTKGVFNGGTGHANSDVITMAGGATVLVDLVSSGIVTQFTVTNTTDVGAHFHNVEITQSSTTGSGINFSLTPDVDNIIGIRMCGLMNVFRGVDTSVPFDGVSPTTLTADFLNNPNPAITPTANNGALLLCQYLVGSPVRDIVVTPGVPATPSGMALGAETSPTYTFNTIVSGYKLDYGAAATLTPTVWRHTFESLFVNAQTEINYDNSPSADGVFAGGTGYSVSDTLTMTGGATVNVDTVSSGIVTEFTVTLGADLGLHIVDEVVASTGGGGSGFTLTPGDNNLSTDHGDDTSMITAVLRPQAAGGNNPHGPLGHPLIGAFGGPI